MIDTIEELTAEEERWIDKMTKVLASGYGTDRGRKPTQVRSAVFRGALIAVLPLLDRFTADMQPDAHPLVGLGRSFARESLTRHRYLPLPGDG